MMKLLLINRYKTTETVASQERILFAVRMAQHRLEHLTDADKQAVRDGVIVFKFEGTAEFSFPDTAGAEGWSTVDGKAVHHRADPELVVRSAQKFLARVASRITGQPVRGLQTCDHTDALDNCGWSGEVCQLDPDTIARVEREVAVTVAKRAKPIPLAQPKALRPNPATIVAAVRSTGAQVHNGHRAARRSKAEQREHPNAYAIRPWDASCDAELAKARQLHRELENQAHGPKNRTPAAPSGQEIAEARRIQKLRENEKVRLKRLAEQQADIQRETDKALAPLRELEKDIELLERAVEAQAASLDRVLAETDPRRRLLRPVVDMLRHDLKSQRRELADLKGQRGRMVQQLTLGQLVDNSPNRAAETAQSA